MERFILAEPAGRTWLAEAPSTLVERARGLLGRDGLAHGEALLLRRCRSVHTLKMRFPIEVVFLDGSYRVLSVKRTPPAHVLLPRLKARHVLECGVGDAPAVGSILSLVRTPKVGHTTEAP